MPSLATIVETPAFRRQIDRLLSTEERGALMARIALDPMAGDLIEGTGGVRKIRFGRQGRGQSGGIRVIYLYIHDGAPIYAFVAYGKNERANLTKAERNTVAALADTYKALHRKEAP